MIFLALNTQTAEWIPVIIQTLATAAAVFGGVGFWQWLMAKDQAKRDKESKENGVEKKVDVVTNTVSNLDNKVDGLSIGLQEIKDDVVLLQQANDETVKYRESRDARDEISAKAQEKVIEALRAMIRDSLLEAYDKCMAKGYYTKEERETYGELFKCYESEPFDGNGVMHQLQPKIQALPWTAEEAGLVEDDTEDEY